MKPSTAVIDVLPRLRRYAFALTGSKTVGDDYIATALRKFAFDHSSHHKRRLILDLYRTFHDVWEMLQIGTSHHQESPDIVRALGEMPSSVRSALLLSDLEGFAVHESAYIVGVDHHVVRDAVAVGRKAFRSLFEKKSVLIVEDDHIVARHLQRVVEGMGLTVLGPARSSGEAKKLAKSTPPSLVLADLMLLDGRTGQDTVEAIRLDHEIPAIFITAWPKKISLSSHETDRVLPKPFSTAALQNAIHGSFLPAAF